VLVAISGPSALLAFLKLRQRNLGPILDACGWAVNGRMKINIPFGAALTCVAKVPPHSLLPFKDPFAEKKTGRVWLWFFVILFFASVVAIAYWNKQREKRAELRKQPTVIVTNAVVITNVTTTVTNTTPATNASSR
jgi:hypothetical protein